MNISLSPEAEKRLSEKFRRSAFVKAAVAEGLQQAERGEGISLEEFDQKLRVKYGIQR